MRKSMTYGFGKACACGLLGLNLMLAGSPALASFARPDALGGNFLALAGTVDVPAADEPRGEPRAARPEQRHVPRPQSAHQARRPESRCADKGGKNGSASALR